MKREVCDWCTRRLGAGDLVAVVYLSPEDGSPAVTFVGCRRCSERYVPRLPSGMLTVSLVPARDAERVRGLLDSCQAEDVADGSVGRLRYRLA